MSGSTAYQNGLAAEDIAVRLYEAQQGRVLERRWKRRSGEIDLIVSIGGRIVFVEVKIPNYFFYGKFPFFEFVAD